MEVVAPAAEGCDLGGVFDSKGFGEEAFDLGAVFEAEGADAEGRGDAFDEAPDGVFGEGPDFYFDARAFEVGDVDEAGLGRDGAAEGVELVVGMSAAGADEAAAALGELPVERLAGEMGAYYCHEESAGGWDGCGEGLGVG